MKIIGVACNYKSISCDDENRKAQKPAFFLMPETALLRNNQPFFYPEFSKSVHYEVELVIKINRLGKNIDKKFANRYYNQIAVGVDFTARDILDTLIGRGLSWELAKAFDNSCPLSNFIDIDTLPDKNNITFSLTKNDVVVQQGSTANMVFNFDEIIEYVSQFFTLKIGDLIYTGTPAGVGPVAIGDTLKAHIADKHMLTVPVK